MPPKKSGDGEGSSDQPQALTDNELRFIKAVFDNMIQKPDANWDAVANTLSLKDAKCAKERWRQMSIRHGWRDNTATSPRKGGAAGDAKVTKKARTPRKKAKKEEDAEIKSEEDEDSKHEKDEVEI